MAHVACSSYTIRSLSSTLRGLHMYYACQSMQRCWTGAAAKVHSSCWCWHAPAVLMFFWNQCTFLSLQHKLLLLLFQDAYCYFVVVCFCPAAALVVFVGAACQIVKCLVPVILLLLFCGRIVPSHVSLAVLGITTLKTLPRRFCHELCGCCSCRCCDCCRCCRC